MPPPIPPQVILFRQLRKFRQLSSREKFYRAELQSQSTFRSRLLRRKYKTALKAQIYGYAVAQRINRWLAPPHAE